MQLVPPYAPYSNFGISLTTHFYNSGNTCNRFYVVHNCWSLPQTFNRWERRFNSWISSISFQTFEQSSFLTTNVGTGSSLHINFQIESTSFDIFTQPSIGLCFGYGFF